MYEVSSEDLLIPEENSNANHQYSFLKNLIHKKRRESELKEKERTESMAKKGRTSDGSIRSSDLFDFMDQLDSQN